MQLRSLVLAAVVLLSAQVSAQDLANGGFQDPWVNGAPPHWGLIWPTSGSGSFTLSPSTTAVCGGVSCQLLQSQGNVAYATFGKQWHTQYSTLIQVGDHLQARVRVKLVSAPATATVRLRAWGQLAAAPWTEVGTPEDVVLQPGPNFQDVCVGYTVTAIPANHLLVRVGIQIDGSPGGTPVDLLLDNVSFLGSSPHFNGGSAVPAPDCAEPYTLRSSDLELQFDEQLGGLLRVRDIRNSSQPVTLLSPPTSGTAKLFDVRTSGGAQITNAGYPSAVISTRRVGTGLEWRYRSGPGSSGFEFEVTASADPAQPDAAIKLGVTRLSSTVALAKLACPILVLDRAVHGASQDEVFFSGGDGSITRGAGLDLGIGSGERLYPGTASMQLLAHYGPVSGLAVAAEDGGAEAKSFSSTPSASTVELHIDHLVPEVAGAPIASYPVVLHAMGKSWMNAARWYKAWARQQFWAVNLPSTRQPNWVAQRPPVFEARWEPLGIGLHLANHDRWPAVIDAWAQDLGTPMSGMFRGIERYGVFIGPYCTPYVDEATLAQTWQTLVDTGHHSMYMDSSMRWSIDRALLPGAAYWIPAFDGNVTDETGASINSWQDPFCTPNGCNPPGVDACAIDSSGNPVIEDPAFAWSPRTGFLCPYPQFARDLIVGQADHAAALGLNVFEFDQINGGGVKPCYSTVHGHPPGYGRWMFDSLDAIFEASRIAGQARDPDFCVSIEEPGELFIPRMASYWGRSFQIAAWPAPGWLATSLVPGVPVSEAVPAFQFVYGDLLPCIQADLGLNEVNYADSPNWNNDEQSKLVQLGRALVDSGWPHIQIAEWMMMYQSACNGPCTVWCDVDGDGVSEIGCNPGCTSAWFFGQPWCYTPSANALEPMPARAIASHRNLLKRAIQMLNGPAAPYVRKTMVSADGISMPTFPFNQGIWDGNQTQTVSRTMPAVQHSAWRHTNGSHGILLLNAALPTVTPSVGTVTLPTAFDGVPIGPNSTVTIYRTTGAPTISPYATTPTVTVPPLEAVFVVIQ